MKIDLKNILFYCGLPIVLGFTVSLLIGDKINYFDVIKQPINIPKWFFIVIWNALYILSGISAYIIDDIGESTKPFFITLVLNLLWMPMFFVLRNNIISILYTIIMFIFVTLNMMKFYRKNKISGLLYIPYFLWMIIGVYQTIGIAILN